MKNKPLKCSLILLFNAILVFSGYQAHSQDCTVNAGGNEIICGSSTTLVGSITGSPVGIPTWEFVSGPTTPTIANPNNFVTEVTGMTISGDYVFKISHPCSDGNTAISNVTVTARHRPADFTAGSDFTTICATTGEVTLDGNIPAGFIGTWRAINIYSLERYGTVVSTNSAFSNTSVSNPTFSLINKGNHQIDPSYYVILDIVSEDGICTYSDTAIVRFVPNPMIQVPLTVSRCQEPEIPLTDPHFFYLSSSPSAGPYFSTGYPGAAGTISAGTTVTFNVIEQPVGGDITFLSIDNNIVLFDGLYVPGSYKFSITVSNACGTYTTPVIDFIFSGVKPKRVNFQPTGHEAPEQLTIYSSAGSGGEIHCDMEGSTDPIEFYFSTHIDNSEHVITDVYQSGIHPPGGDPTISVLGAGTRDRQVILTPPAGGWSVGTYEFIVSTKNPDGSCPTNQAYYVHISDKGRTDVKVDDVSVCFPGTGAISAVIELPEVYKGVVNSSYFQKFNAHYKIELISKPAGASNPQYTATNLRSIESTSTIISNLDKIGDYYFSITPVGYNLDVAPFLQYEYECSNASMIDTFMIRVENPVNSNAGSDQILGFVDTASLVGNDPGDAIGEWEIISAPEGVNPIIVDIHAPITTVEYLTGGGDYQFSWTIVTPYGGCISSDTVMISTMGPLSVNWVSFTARKEYEVSVLKWATANETDNKGFEIQRSADGTNWTTIGYVQSLSADGNSRTILEYNFTDKMPINGSNYYRLKQVDFDGAFTYSSIELVEFDKLNDVKIFPNPSNGIITLTGLQKESSNIYITNYVGQRVMDFNLVNQKEHTLNISDLLKGVYFVTIIYTDGTSSTIKLVKE